MTDQFNPDAWLTSLFDSLTDYINGVINAYVTVSTVPRGLELYDVVMSFPDSQTSPISTELAKTVIHFEVDDIENKDLGFGYGFTNAVIVEGDETTAGTITEQAGRSHTVNFDVGVWASDETGGVTSRLRAYEMLDKCFNGQIARENCRAVTGGVEIRSYEAGRFITEGINDVRVFRIVGAELVVRVYSRDYAAEEVLVDGEPDQNQELEIRANDGSLAPLTD
jgi:hypothetical protein